jgi:hypothetical protein
MAAEVVTPFHGDKEDENPEDFLRAFFRRMGDKSGDTRRAQFKYYLQADSAADEWYADLDDDEKDTWEKIEVAFEKRWPREKQSKKTDDDYEDEIMGRKLKAEELGKKEKVAGRDVYSHVAWADKMATSVKGAKWEKTTNHLRQVRRGLPNILREKIGTGHAHWGEFLKAVRDVDIEYIRDSIDIKNKEQAAIDQRFRTLEALSNSPTAPIRQRMSTFNIGHQASPTPTSQQAVVPQANLFTSTSGGQGNLFTQTRASNPTYTQRPPPSQADKAAIQVQLAKYPQHPDTDAGRKAHQAQQMDWMKTHGIGTRITESTPYPLRPGTAPINSGECFTCGFVGHFGRRDGATCEGHRALHPNEQAWRAICARILKVPKGAVNIHFVAVDDYGTTLQDVQGNEEGSST